MKSSHNVLKVETKKHENNRFYYGFKRLWFLHLFLKQDFGIKFLYNGIALGINGEIECNESYKINGMSAAIK